jgi:hypothetical protein
MCSRLSLWEPRLVCIIIRPWFVAHLASVGVGRPFLYAYSAYGQEGIDKALQILHVSIGVTWRVLILLKCVGRDGDEHATVRCTHHCRRSARNGGCNVTGIS